LNQFKLRFRKTIVMNTVVVTNHQITNSKRNSESSLETDPQTDWEIDS